MSDVRPCRECRDWRNCLLTSSEREWFGYQHIRFCPIQIFWLLRYEDILRGRAWPVPDDSAPGGMGSKTLSEADFVLSSTLLAELDDRLNQVKPNIVGEKLRDECKIRDKVEYLSDEARDALYYIVGSNRSEVPFYIKTRHRKTSFRVWKAMNRYRNDNSLQKCAT